MKRTTRLDKLFYLAVDFDLPMETQDMAIILSEGQNLYNQLFRVVLDDLIKRQSRFFIFRRFNYNFINRSSSIKKKFFYAQNDISPHLLFMIKRRLGNKYWKHISILNKMSQGDLFISCEIDDSLRKEYIEFREYNKKHRGIFTALTYEESKRNLEKNKRN